MMTNFISGFVKNSYLIILILFLALFLRLIFLDRTPSGITYDELHFVLNAKAVAMTGHDISGKWSPWSLTTIPGEFPTSELSFIVVAPFFNFLSLSLFNARLPFVLLSVLGIFIFYLINKKLLNKSYALIISFVFAINPWSIYLSRTSYDSVISLLFFLLGFCVLLYARRWYLLFSFPAFFLAFYTYIASKIVFIPFVFISLFYTWYFTHKKKFSRQYILLLSSVLCLFLFFVFTLAHQHSSVRLGEIFLPSNQEISNEVNHQRQVSIATPLSYIFSNKITIYAKDLLDKYIGSFSSKALFVNGDGVGLSFVYTGFFYYADFLFFLIGFYSFFKKKQSVGWFCLSILAISQLPGLFHTDSSILMTEHSILFYPFFMTFIGVGIYQLVKWSKTYKYSIIFIILAVYALSLTYFLYSYFFRYPIENSEAFNFSNRILSSYIKRESLTKKSIFVVSPNLADAEGLFKNFIFYNNLYNTSSANEIKILEQKHKYAFQNVSFIAYAKTLTLNQDSTVILDNHVNYHISPKSNPLIIPQLKDSGSIFSIFNGSTCRFMHAHYIQNISFTDLNVENLTNNQFCNTYIVEY